MKHSRILEILNKYKMIQYVIGIVPVMLVILFSLLNTYDLSTVYASIHKNDMAAKWVEPRKVISQQHVNDLYKFEAESTDTIEFSKKPNSELFTLYAKTNTCTTYWVDDDTNLDVYNSVLVGVGTATEEGITYTILDKEYTVKQGAKLASIYLDNNNEYKFIVYKGNDFDEYTLEEVYGLQVVGSSEADGFKFKLTNGGVLALPDMNSLYITSILPTDDYYIDFENQTLLKNAVKDYKYNFILGSKAHIVLFSSIVFLILVYICNRTGALEELKRKEYLIMHLIGFVCITFNIMLTFVML